jgi:hypothetical protein
VIIVFFLVGGALTTAGWWLFEPTSFSENLVAEAIGLSFSLGIAVWLIEGPVLTRERRLRQILSYKWKVFQIIWEIGSLLARDIAEPLAGDFEPGIDLYGDERAKWRDFEPLLREVFRQARIVPEEGLPAYPSVDEKFLHSVFESARSMVSRIDEVIDFEPNLKNEVSRQIIFLHQVDHTIERAERLVLAGKLNGQYKLIGEIGDQILDVVDIITPLPEGNRPHSP